MNPNEVLSGFSPVSAQNPISFSGGLGASGSKYNNSGDSISPTTGLDFSAMKPERRRSDATQKYLGLAKDAFDYITGVDPQAYMGKTAATLLEMDKIRMEEDPEGRQIDLNRAKVLSQRAYNETDEVKKAIYGREIKKLLPEETQGLDDLTAADMFTSNEKIELEKYKQAGRMQIQEAKNRGAYDVATLKTMSAEQINREKLNAQWDIAKLKAEYNKAIQEGKNDTALTIQEMITDRQYDLHMMDNAAKLKQTEMQQAGANFRTVTQQEGQTTRTLAQNASREEIARMQADIAREQIAGRERVAQINAEARIKSSASGVGKQQAKDDADRANWANIEARHDYQNSRFNEAINLMSQYTVFGPVAGRASDWGWASSEALEAKGRIKSILTSAVEERLKAVREAAGTAKAADSEKEGARVIGYLTGDSTVPQETIMGALQDFMETSDKALQLRKNELFGTKVSTQGQVLNVGQTTNVGGFKVTRRQ